MPISEPPPPNPLLSMPINEPPSPNPLLSMPISEPPSPNPLLDMPINEPPSPNFTSPCKLELFSPCSLRSRGRASSDCMRACVRARVCNNRAAFEVEDETLLIVDALADFGPNHLEHLCQIRGIRILPILRYQHTPTTLAFVLRKVASEQGEEGDLHDGALETRFDLSDVDAGTQEQRARSHSGQPLRRVNPARVGPEVLMRGFVIDTCRVYGAEPAGNGRGLGDTERCTTCTGAGTPYHRQPEHTN